MPRRRTSKLIAESVFEANAVAKSDEEVTGCWNFLTRKCSRVCVAATCGLLVAAVVLALGGVTLATEDSWHVVVHLSHDVHTLESTADYYYSYAYYHAYSMNTNESTEALEGLEDPLDLFAAFEDQYVHAKRELPELRRTSNEFRKFKNAFEALYYVQASILEDAAEWESQTTKTAMDERLKRAKDFLHALNDIRGRHNELLKTCVVFSLCAAVFALAVGSLLWIHAIVSLHQSETSMGIRRALIDGMGVSAIVVDSNRKIIVANKAACCVFGYDDKELLGQAIENLLPHPPRLRFPPACRRRSRRSLFFAAYDGSKVDEDDNASAPTAKGNKTTMDDSAAGGVHRRPSSTSRKSTNLHHSTTKVSSAAALGFGASSSSDPPPIRRGSGGSSFLRPHRMSHRSHSVRMMTKTGGDQCEGRTKRGKRLLFLVNVTSFREVTGEAKSILVCQDITELVSKAHELDNQRDVLTEFSRRLQAKYTPAIHVLDRIQSVPASVEDGDEVRRELLGLDEDISSCIASLEEADLIIATRLDLFAVFTGTYQTEPNIEDVGLEGIMADNVEATARRATRGVKFKAVLPEEYSGMHVRGRFDVHLFGHIASNLLSNARRYTTQGHVIFRLIGEDSNMLTFAVEDQGKGIAPDIRQRILREDGDHDSTSTFGMGLRTCRRFARTIKGDVWLEKTVTKHKAPDRGSEFRFRIPGNIVVNSEDIDRRACRSERPHHADYFGGPNFPSSSSLASLTHSTPSQTARQLPTPPPTNSLLSPTLADPPYEATHNVASEGEGNAQDVLATPKVLKSLRVVIVDDSRVVRKLIKFKLEDVCRKIGGSWTFEQFETVESLLAKVGVDDLVKERNVLITIDESLEGTGGVLTGCDLIKKLAAASFRGVMASASAGTQANDEHLALGADFVFDNPLPQSDKILALLRRAFASKEAGTDAMQNPANARFGRHSGLSPALIWSAAGGGAAASASESPRPSIAEAP